MGLIATSQAYIAFCFGKSIIIYNQSTSETQTLAEPNIGKKGSASEKNDSSYESKVVASKFSPDGLYFVAAFEAKIVVVWCTQTWQHLASHSLVKRPMALTFTKDSSKLLVADKTGDVYEYPVLGRILEADEVEPPVTETLKNEFDEPGEHKPILGHLSMLLDVILSPDDKYVITCDRDEKIRVSYYPSAFDIHTFCLSHTEFVTQISLLPGNPRHLYSCSGDGTFWLWDYEKGQPVVCMDTREHLQHTDHLLAHYQKHRDLKNAESREQKKAENREQKNVENRERKNAENKEEKNAENLKNKSGETHKNKYQNGQKHGEPEDKEQLNAENEDQQKREDSDEQKEDNKTQEEKKDNKDGELESGRGVELRRTLPDYPAVKSFAVNSITTETHLVAGILDKVSAVFLYKIKGCEITHVATRNLTSEPHAVAWTNNGELVVVQSGPEKVGVFHFTDGQEVLPDSDKCLQPLPEHPLLEVGRKFESHFEGWVNPLDMDSLYKQRYDNVAEYLKKKEERLANEKAAQEGLCPPVKKGRWVK